MNSGLPRSLLSLTQNTSIPTAALSKPEGHASIKTLRSKFEVMRQLKGLEAATEILAEVLLGH